MWLHYSRSKLSHHTNQLDPGPNKIWITELMLHFRNLIFEIEVGEALISNIQQMRLPNYSFGLWHWRICTKSQ